MQNKFKELYNNYANFSNKYEIFIILFIIIVFFIALLLNVYFSEFNEYGPDGKTYIKLGERTANSSNLFDCGNFDTSYWAPGWIVVIGLIFKIFGYNLMIVRLFLILCSTLSALLIYYIARKKFDVSSAILSTILYLATTLVFRFTVHYHYEIFLGFQILLIIVLFFINLKNTNSITIISIISFINGLICGWSCLTSGKMMLLVLCFFVILFLINKENFLHKVLPVLIGFALIITLWVYRNYDCFNKFILLTTNGGITLYIANNPDAHIGYYFPPEGLEYKNRFQESNAWTNEALNYIINNPMTTIERMIKRMFLFFNPHYGDQALLTFLFFIGVYRFIKDKAFLQINNLWIICPPFIFMFIHMIFQYEFRFITPVLPIMAIISASAFSGWKNSLNNETAKTKDIPS